MNPLIFYRIATPAKDLTKLPSIGLTRFYSQSGNEEETIRFTVKKVNLGSKNVKDYLPLIPDPETHKDFEALSAFRPDDDR